MRRVGNLVVELLTVAGVVGLALGTLSLTQRYGQADPAPKVRPSPQSTADAAPPQPTATESRTIGDWLLSCVTIAGKKQCSIAQRLTDKNSNTVVFAWTIAKDANGNLVAIWDTPTGVLVNQGVALDVGSAQPLVVPYRACTAQQCEAAANLAAAFVTQLTSVPKATATIVATSGQRVTFNFSVNGLAEGLAALAQ